MKREDIKVGDVVSWEGVNGDIVCEVEERGGVLVCDTGGGYCLPIEYLVSSRSFRVVKVKA